MKKIIILLLLVTTIVLCKDTTDVHLKDTLITKSVSENTFWNYNLLQTFISVLAGGVLTLIGVWFSNRHQRIIADEQIKHQLIVAQANIDVATKRKFIDDLIRLCSLIANDIFTMISLTNDFRINKITLSDNTKELAVIKNDLSDNVLRFNELQQNVRHYGKKVEDLFDKIYDLNKELIFNTDSLFLYIYNENKHYDLLKEQSNNLKKHFEDYLNWFKMEYDEFPNIGDIRKEAADNLTKSNTGLADTIKFLIDEKRNEIDDIILVKPKNTLPTDDNFIHSI